MTASGIVRGLALVWLVFVAAAVVESTLTGQAAWLPGGSPSTRDALDQELSEGATPEQAPVAYLQMALLQIDDQGRDEALLCGQNVPLLAGQSRTARLRFRDLRNGPHVRNIPKLAQHMRTRERLEGERCMFRYGVMLPAAFPAIRASARLQVSHGGIQNGLHQLNLEGGVGGESEHWRKPEPEDPLKVVAMQLGEGGCAVEIAMELGVALLLRVSAQPVPDHEVGTRAFWRDAMQSMAVATPVAGDVLPRRPSESDLASTALLWHDQELAERLQSDHSAWLDGSDNTWAQLLSARWDRSVADSFVHYSRPFDFTPARSFVLRARALQREPALAESLNGWLAPANAQSWWLLVAVAVAVVLLLRFAPATANPRILVSRSAILLMWLCNVIEFAGATGALFALTFALLLLPRLPRGTTGLYRVISVLGLVAAIVWSLRWLGLLSPMPWLDAYASLGRTFCWLVVGHWLMRDPSWHGRGWFVLFLLALCTALGASVFHHVYVDPAITKGVHAGGLVTATIALLWFLAGKRERQAERPEPLRDAAARSEAATAPA